MFGIAQHRCRARYHRTRILQVGGRVGGAAVFAVVTVLVRAAAARAVTLDVAVRQEHGAFRIEQLLDRTTRDEAALAQPTVDKVGQRLVFRGMGGMVVVEGHAELREVALVPGLDVADEVFRREPSLLGSQHDRRAVGIVGADKVDQPPVHATGAYPDVSLDVADQVAQVQRAVGVGQGGGNEGGGGFHAWIIAEPRPDGLRYNGRDLPEPFA